MKNIIKLFGIIALVAVIGLGIVSCGDDDDTTVKGEGKKPEQMTTAERWSTWTDVDSTATTNISVASNDVCTITVGGTALPPQEVGDGYLSYWNSIWKANAGYKYTAVAGKTYTYTFEAWTDGDDRAMIVHWYGDAADGVYQHSGYSGEATNPPTFSINSTRTTYSVTGSEPIPKSGVQALEFQCANQTGTFYVKIISIKTDAFTGTWIMTGEVRSSRIVAANGTWVMSETVSYDEFGLPFWTYSYDGMKGTYTMSGNTVNATLTHLTQFFLDRDTAGANQWIAFADLSEEAQVEFGNFGNISFTITGNQFTANGGTFTKQ